jgi:hypothetical protein
MKDFVLPLTSEFYGISMDALKKLVASNRGNFSDKDRGLAAMFAKGIQKKWFEPSG